MHGSPGERTGRLLSSGAGLSPVQNLTFGYDSDSEEEDCNPSAIDALVDAIEVNATITRQGTKQPQDRQHHLSKPQQHQGVDTLCHLGPKPQGQHWQTLDRPHKLAQPQCR